MAIEFRCTSCGKLLRTADGTSGKQAKCPECASLMTIPAATAQGIQRGRSGLGGAGRPGSGWVLIAPQGTGAGGVLSPLGAAAANLTRASL